MNKIDLKNKVAIVTGGAQGFGLAIVEKFLASDAKVIIWDKDKEMMSALNLGDNVQRAMHNRGGTQGMTLLHK